MDNYEVVINTYPDLSDSINAFGNDLGDILYYCPELEATVFLSMVFDRIRKIAYDRLHELEAADA